MLGRRVSTGQISIGSAFRRVQVTLRAALTDDFYSRTFDEIYSVPYITIGDRNKLFRGGFCVMI